MQILGPGEGALPELPATPILEKWLYESPTLPVAVLALGAVLVLGMALKRRKKAPGLIAAGVLAIGAASVWATAGRVTTQREQISRRTAQLVGAVAESDLVALRSLLDQEFRIGPSDNASGVASRIPRVTSFDQLASVLTTKFGEPGSFVGSHQVLETRAGLDGEGVGRTLVRVRVRGPQDAYISHSWWEIQWMMLDGAWLATRIEAIWIQG